METQTEAENSRMVIAGDWKGWDEVPNTERRNKVRRSAAQRDAVVHSNLLCILWRSRREGLKSSKYQELIRKENANCTGLSSI